MNIALIGFRGAGKTTVAMLLAKKLNRKLISTDSEIAKRMKLSIDKIVKKYGWEKFRDAESDVIERICDFDDCVFDTGGGVIVRNENIVNLKRSALVILLTADLKSFTERIKESEERPPLTDLGSLKEIKKVMQERDERYKKASDYTIDTSRLTPEEVCDLISHYVEMELK